MANADLARIINSNEI